ncbi:MAG: hypothetical protein JXQ82_02630 [Methanomicrobiaceae archaeon]|nr:hypothetical protein [Methanomicrobiaceae archaeon]
MESLRGRLKNPKAVILTFVVLFSIFLEYYVHLYLGITIIYTQFFYVLIAICGFWYGRKVVFIGIFLAIMTLSNTFILTGGFSPDSLIRGLMFVLVAMVVGELSHNVEKEHNALIAYISEATMRVKSPAASIKNNLEEISEQTDDEDLKTVLGIQIKNASQIIDNIQEINRNIVEKENDIPDAYREFLTKNS